MCFLAGVPELGQRGWTEDGLPCPADLHWRRPAWVQIPPPAPFLLEFLLASEILYVAFICRLLLN